ncbi:anti-sigma factor C-terminal domain-containing protein [Weissella confusa]|uniref:anti-sigma factor C-terminal domain-containing protein n=1 Tax=Weissella confusa TaxID=1583 RepID=UPI001C6FBD18|nr:anti-sigma factor C-terminal domain-containing protein [Weissella confusa]QYU57801.1 anti-sigma factor C-terminal domain-containing protein [Weissella confusa]
MKRVFGFTFAVLVVGSVAVLFLFHRTDKQGALMRADVEHWTNITTPNVQTNYLVASGIGRLMGRVDYRASKKISSQAIHWKNQTYLYNAMGRDQFRQNSQSYVDGSWLDSENGQRLLQFNGKTQERFVRADFSKFHDNDVADLAVTFKSELTYDEIKRGMPGSVAVTWLWSGIATGNAEYVGVPIGKEDPTGDYRYYLKSYNRFKSQMSWPNQVPNLALAKFPGVVITGNIADLKALETSDKVDKVSLGVVMSSSEG